MLINLFDYSQLLVKRQRVKEPVCSQRTVPLESSSTVWCPNVGRAGLRTLRLIMADIVAATVNGAIGGTAQSKSPSTSAVLPLPCHHKSALFEVLMLTRRWMQVLEDRSTSMAWSENISMPTGQWDQHSSRWQKRTSHTESIAFQE